MFGFSVWLMAQEYTSIPKIITRNINYFILNKINDNVSIDRIIKNLNVCGAEKEVLKKAYYLSIKEPLDFVLLDLKSRSSFHLDSVVPFDNLLHVASTRSVSGYDCEARRRSLCRRAEAFYGRSCQISFEDKKRVVQSRIPPLHQWYKLGRAE